MNSETKTCQNCKNQFTIEPEDFVFYEKMQVPPPVECFDCRLQRQLAFWIFGKFHKRKCDKTGEDIISIFSPQTHFPIYKTSEWFSDSWTPPSMEYDPSRPFIEQLYELQRMTPHPHQFGTKNENCEYSDDVWESKGVYLSRAVANCENLSYSLRVIRCRDSYELTYCYDTEQSYDCTYCFKVYNVKYAFDVRDSLDSSFLYDCRNVSNCFMCWNLRSKKFHILNQPYSEEEYFKKIKEFKLNSWESVEKLKKEFSRQIQENAIHKQNLNTKNVNSIGNGLAECKNCIDTYFVENAENCKNVFRGFQNKDSYDSTAIWDSVLGFEVMQLSHGYNMKYSLYCTSCRDSEYLDLCNDCSNCFGCVGLKKKQYCILNKQYTKEEYEKITEQIKESMKKDGSFGKFFPLKFSYSGYNLSYAGMMYPLNEKDVLEFGSSWEELETARTTDINIAEYIDDVRDVSESITNKGFVCEETGRPFNIKKEELNFYRQKEIPIPRTYPDVRSIKRMKDLSLIKPYNGKCFFCLKDIVHYYPPHFSYKKIACEKCYLKEVI